MFADCPSLLPTGGPVPAEFDSRRERMATASQLVRVTADLTMQVPRNATGDLAQGVTNVVRGVDAVAHVDEVDVTDLRPRLNDLRVDATVAVEMTVEDAPDVERASRDAFGDGFGIEAVESVDAERGADRATADTGERVQEYG